MNLKTFFHKYYKHFVHALNAMDRDVCLDIIERAGLEDTGFHWKSMVLKFRKEFGEVPEHVHNMMMLSESDQKLQEYTSSL
jgi:hypothetical protein